MNTLLHPDPDVALYYATLWLSALMLAAHPALEVARAFFSRFKPAAKA